MLSVCLYYPFLIIIFLFLSFSLSLSIYRSTVYSAIFAKLCIFLQTALLFIVRIPFPSLYLYQMVTQNLLYLYQMVTQNLLYLYQMVTQNISLIVLISDGNSELVAHAASKIGLSGEKISDLWLFSI